MVAFGDEETLTRMLLSVSQTISAMADRERGQDEAIIKLAQSVAETLSNHSEVIKILQDEIAALKQKLAGKDQS